jgi:hypothetical protein
MRIIRISSLLVFVLLMTTNCLHAQVTVTGKITDSLGKPLSSVSITLVKKRSGVILGFAISNANGVYKIQHNTASIKDTLSIEASSLGFAKQSFPVTAAVQASDFKLHGTSTKLPNVSVQNNKPFIKKTGDTLNYDVAAYSNPQDRSIGDVIKKLPGVEMDANGKISYQGKPINRFYIDGDNLLDDKYNIATKSVPSDMVSKVQVLENHQPVKALQNMAVSEDAAMNIVMKDKARVKIFGEGNAAVGLPDLYNGTINLMLFKKQAKFINYFKLNNTGYDLSNEVTSHGFGGGQQASPPPTLVDISTAGDPPLSNSRYLYNNAGLINLNNMYTLNGGMQFRVNAYYYYDRQFAQNQNKTTIFLPGDTIRYAENQNNRLNKNTFRTQFTLNSNKPGYYLNSVLAIENTPQVAYADLQATSNNNIQQQLSGTVTNFSNELNYMKVLHGRKVLEGFSSVAHSNNPASLWVMPGLYAGLVNNNIPFAALQQDGSIPSFNTNNYLKFSIASDKFMQSYKAGFSYQQQQLNSDLLAQQTNGSIAAVADSFINKFDWQRLKIYAQADYTWIRDWVQLSASLPITYQDTKYKGRIAEKDLVSTPFTPSLQAKFTTGKESFLTARYALSNTFGNINEVYDAYILRNYRSLSSNASLLNENQTRTASLGYSYRNTLKILFVNLAASYITTERNTISYSTVSSVLQQSKSIPFANLSHGVSLAGGVSKYIFPLLTTLGAKVAWQENVYNQLLNGNLLQYQNDTYSFSGSLNTKLSSWLNFAYSGTFAINSSKPLDNTHNTNPVLQEVKRWQQTMDVNVIATQNLYFKLGAEQYYTHSPYSQDIKIVFVDASCTYKINKLKTDVELSLNNLANVRNYTTLSVSSTSVVENSYYIRPRMALIKFLYRF